MNSNITKTRTLNDVNIAQKQRQASQLLGTVMSPLEARLEKAFLTYRDQPLLHGFCNLFERNLTVDLDAQTFVLGDMLRINTALLQDIEAAKLTEAEKNAQVFWLILYHCTYFVLGYQLRVMVEHNADKLTLHMACSQTVLHQLAALRVDQPQNSEYWLRHGYKFKPLISWPADANMENSLVTAINNGQVTPSTLTESPLLELSERQCAVGSVQDYEATTHENFAQEMLNEWLAEFSKCNSFGDQSFNGIRLLYFKSNPPRDVSEALMECLQSKYPVTDDVALYNNKKLANDYYAPRKADPILETTGHIELFIDCSGSISSGDVGDCIKIFTDFFTKKRKKMTYSINTFDTSILSKIDVLEDEDPNVKLKELAILGGGGTDFRCIAKHIQDLTDAGNPGPNGKPYKADLAIVFTDLAGCFPDTTPCDFVWVTTTKQCNLGSVSNTPIPGSVVYI